VEVPHQERVFFRATTQNYVNAQIMNTNSFCSESRRLTPYRFTPYGIKFLSQTGQIH
jgi:hypothetical protein